MTGLISLTLMNYPVRANAIWIDVDTNKHTLTVLQGNAILAVFENVAIGRFGTTLDKQTKDDKTPLGRFRIGWINENSRYYRFFGLDYPNLETAKRALDENRITHETWLSILGGGGPMSLGKPIAVSGQRLRLTRDSRSISATAAGSSVAGFTSTKPALTMRVITSRPSSVRTTVSV
jgi:hypothetical protein